MAFALGGKINNTGPVEIFMGTPFGTLYELGGGCPNGKAFGGKPVVLRRVVSAEHIDMP